MSANHHANQDEKMRQRDREIADSWRIHNDEEISTARLLSMVMDDTGCEVSRVISGLVREGILEAKTP